MYLLRDNGSTHEIISGAGDELGDTIEACIRWCVAKDCQVILHFNGVKRHINKGTYAKGLTDNYFDPNYVSLQETRDKKLKDLGI